jgi:hypothetical protein
LKEIPFTSFTNAIDLKIESSNGLFDWLKQIVQPIKKPVRTLSIFMSMAFVKDAKGISFKNSII